jgi:hypothetical protein
VEVFSDIGSEMGKQKSILESKILWMPMDEIERG